MSNLNCYVKAARFAPTLKTHRFGDGNRTSMVENLGPRDVVVSIGAGVNVEDMRELLQDQG